MVGLAAHNSKSGPVPPLARAPSRNHSSKNLTRHVSFSETHLKQPQKPSQDAEAQRPGRCGSRCNMFCAWASLIVGSFIIILLLGGIVLFAFLQANLPEFRVQRLDIHKLDVVTSKKGETLLTADFELRINATNKNDKIALSYSPLTVDVSSEEISLGRMQLPTLYQKPHTTSDLKIRSGVTKYAVDEYDAKDLKSNSKVHLMVIDVVFKGTITFVLNGNKVNSFAFKVLCENIDQSEIDSGHAPECNVKITPFGFS